ncbi:hypothetical protein Phou_033030 [Phytohabitans houttuyneae]|uniref:Uncharacterized protein n=1 Tax=Phytohabitans houttuyneae TaxID=1076126 RepID=A0A6V8K1X4_9ACTN|nr:hypothetical protein Phou_033030 [Phytohabitans houttuyneae]
MYTIRTVVLIRRPFSIQNPFSAWRNCIPVRFFCWVAGGEPLPELDAGGRYLVMQSESPQRSSPDGSLNVAGLLLSYEYPLSSCGRSGR